MPDRRFVVVCVLLAVLTGCASAEPAGEPNAPAGSGPIVAQPNASAPEPEPAVPDEVDAILKTLNRNLLELRSCRLELSWRFYQPLLEASTVRTGTLYYKKGHDRSHLRINFSSLKQDQEQPQPLREEIIFDGVWLTRIDYQLKEIKRDQLAPDDKPLDAFQLLTGRIPIISFESIDNLKKQFDIALGSPADPNERVHLVFTPRPDSEFIRDYKKIEILTKATAALPQRIRAVTPDDDLNEIVLKRSGSQDVADSVFTFEKPRDFTIISKPLKSEDR